MIGAELQASQSCQTGGVLQGIALNTVNNPVVLVI